MVIQAKETTQKIAKEMGIATTEELEDLRRRIHTLELKLADKDVIEE